MRGYNLIKHCIFILSVFTLLDINDEIQFKILSKFQRSNLKANLQHESTISIYMDTFIASKYFNGS